MQFAGNVGDHLVFSAVPRFSYDKDDTTANLQTGYIKTNINNMEIQVGKEAMWWGEGIRGTRSFTNNAPALTSIKLTNIDTLRPSRQKKSQLHRDFKCYQKILIPFRC